MEKFIEDTHKLIGIHLSSSQVRLFSNYEHELLVWNEKFNLTAIREPESIRTKHFLDSLSAILEIKTSPNKLIDVGTGAGFPGIPLKIIFPSMQLTLLESVGKKAEFYRHMVDVLQLENVEVLNIRAEDLGQNPRYREKFDWAVARAVASMPILMEYLLPLVKVGGSVLAQKGENAHAEAQTAEKAILLLGGNLRRITKVTLPGVVEERFLVLVDKKATTPSQYPRRAGLPSRKPL
jgi:16S rRNA (guanine527-N7)-methyltransferase